MIRVLVVDDQALVRAGFCKLLAGEEDIDVVGEAGDGVDAVELAGRLRPDVVLMDIRMPRLDGLAATRTILAGAPGGAGGARSRVLILSTFDMDEYVFEALRAGASGFLLKDAPPDDLVAAIHVVAAGDSLLAPSITRRLIEEFAARPAASLQLPESLTARELDVLRLTARGLSNAEIAATLFLGESTIKTHLGNVLAKLGVRDRVQAVVYAYESGLVTPGDAAGS